MRADPSRPTDDPDFAAVRTEFDPAATEHPFLELARGEQNWIRARRLPDGMYELQHRCGADPRRFELYTSDHCLVRDLLCAWLDDAPGWSEAAVWSPVDPAIEELERVRNELSGLLGGLTVLDDLGAGLDLALARADELMSDLDAAALELPGQP
ncbi:hypothetical protein [Nocardia amikacinitolerans]|uniref:hypothetical protein n=1 Tax=Nocardia amikacinitolerans TaxID=756689 RepID=UPI0020A2E7AD|nr:hypothetical protein [Nocardia amikacinitolerans]MCP2288534.1 hypothetical protein [Nocardia amikacinitolerans]